MSSSFGYENAHAGERRAEQADQNRRLGGSSCVVIHGPSDASQIPILNAAEANS